MSSNNQYFKDMACSESFIEFITEALAPLGEVRSRKMMEEAYILDFADKTRLFTVIETLWEHLPYPKSKKK